jgi:exonuclease III
VVGAEAFSLLGGTNFSCTPVRRTRPCPAPSDSFVRWLDIDLSEYGFGIGVLHVMAAGSSTPSTAAKTSFWNAVRHASGDRLQEPFLFVGDWNMGAYRIDETDKTFVGAEHFGRLSKLGWTDMWRHHHPGVTEWTWYSKLKGGTRGTRTRTTVCAPLVIQVWIRKCTVSFRQLTS